MPRQRRRALVVGVDFYERARKLHGCVNDARAVAALLKRNGDEDRTKNFDVETILADGEASAVSRERLKDQISATFADDYDVSLLYFAGHGHVEGTEGYLLGSEATRGDDGLALSEILRLVRNSEAKSKIIVLDSCHSGLMGASPLTGAVAEISEGTVILTASTSDQYATESKGSGLFTSLFVSALEGGAANLLGDITPGSVYAHIDQSLNATQQRPVFKANVEQFVSLRTVACPISLSRLHLLTQLFPYPEYEFPLDETYEHTSDRPDPDKCKIFKVLQRYNRINLLVPVGEEDMYFAAMNEKSCKLTRLGHHYWRLVKDEVI